MIIFKSKEINWAFSFEADFFFKGSNLASPADAKLAHVFAYIVFVLVDLMSGVLFSPNLCALYFHALDKVRAIFNLCYCKFFNSGVANA